MGAGSAPAAGAWVSRMTRNDDRWPRLPRTVGRWLVHSLWLLALPVGAFAAEFPFNIPAQRGDIALTAFAQQTGVSLLFPYDKVAGVTTNRVVGTYSLEEGIRLLLAGTGLTSSIEETRQVILRIAPTGAAAPGDARRTAQQGEAVGTGREQGEVARRVLNEVVVTARRREESLQRVPLSVLALSEPEITMRNVANISDLNAFYPNVSIRGGGTSGGAEGKFVIRGIPGVARYVDGVVQQGDEGALVSILALERVEVLRGPQGTLFGKNAIGGAIQYITRKPSEHFGGRVDATTGSSGRRDVVGYVDVPLGETLTSGIAFAALNRDGFVQGEQSGLEYGNQDIDMLRGQLLWHPDDRLRLTLSVDWSEVHERQQANVLYDVIEDHPRVLAYNAAGLPFTDATHAFGGREQYRNRSTYKGLGNQWDSAGFVLTADWSLSDRLQLRSITGGREFTWGNYQDLDASEYAYFEQWYYRKGTDLSQEFQLQLTSRLVDWTLGAYYARQRREGLALRWQYEELGGRGRNDVTATATRDLALFGEATFQPTDRWAITAGLRYTRQDFATSVYAMVDPRPAWQQISRDLRHGAQAGPAQSVDFDSVTPRLSIQYNWSDHVMSYVTYAQGFNAGGINGGAPVNSENPAFDEETLSQYEFGLRSALWDDRLRLNASLFEGYWQDIQIGEVIVPGQITTRNAGAARLTGFELEAAWYPIDGVTLSASGGWLDIRYVNVGETTAVTLDSELPYAPHYSYALGLSYERPMAAGGTLRFRGDYGWLDDHVTTTDYRLQKKQEAYGLLGARLAYISASGRWEASLSGTNLTSEWYQLGGFSAALAGIEQGVPSRPREIGLGVGIRF